MNAFPGSPSCGKSGADIDGHKPALGPTSMRPEPDRLDLPMLRLLAWEPLVESGPEEDSRQELASLLRVVDQVAEVEPTA